MPEKDEILTGTVIRAAAGAYEVDVPRPDGHLTLLSTLRGLLKKGKREMAQPVSVGDQVRVRNLDSLGPNARGQRLQEGYIEEVLPRRSVLGRSRYQKTSQVTVANLDQVLIVMALREPELNTHRLDRFLVLAEASDLDAIICLNKADLLKKRELKAETTPLIELYSGLGYTIIVTSAETDIGVEEVREKLNGHITAVLGSSGVGKSSLINAVQSGLHLWVGDVMDMGKGRHTTTEVTLHPLDAGGYIADTPGIKTVSLLEQQDVNLPACFPEFQQFLNCCRFNNCQHLQEPGCAVHAAVESGEINATRYDSYVKMLQEAKTREANKYKTVLR